MKNIIIIALILIVLLLIFMQGCLRTNNKNNGNNSYTSITAKEAKKMMDEQVGYIILDVRTEAEYNSGYIKGAILLPNEEIGKDEIEILPNKDQLILVYCRSGNRSKQAAAKLVKLGYTNVYEFGGITNWPYDIEHK